MVLGYEAGSSPTDKYDGILSVPLQDTENISHQSSVLLRQQGGVMDVMTQEDIVMNENAEDCMIASYGKAKCARLIGEKGHIGLQTDGSAASCFASYSKYQLSNTTARPVLAALDVNFGGFETPTPLHIIGCSILWCNSVNSSHGEMNCEPGFGDIGLKSASVRLEMSEQHKQGKWNIFPLVGASDGHSLDGSLWDFSLENNDAEIRTAIASDSETHFGVITLLSIEQNQ